MKTFLLLFATVLLASSCAPLTPQARIDANPAIYQKLSKSHQKLVSQGQIEQGMPPEAVYLAWGKASREYAGSGESGSTMRWDYAGTRAVSTYGYHPRFAYGYRRFGSYRYYHGYPYGGSITYLPYRKASVWFSNERVTRWERLR